VQQTNKKLNHTVILSGSQPNNGYFKFAERLANLPAFASSLNWLWGILVCKVFLFLQALSLFIKFCN